MYEKNEFGNDLERDVEFVICNQSGVPKAGNRPVVVAREKAQHSD